MEDAEFCDSRILSSNILIKASEATASRQQDLPFMRVQEMSLIDLVYLILGTLIFYKGLLEFRLKLMKATVLVISIFYSYSSAEFTKIFIPLNTLLGEVYMFLQPTAIMAYSSFTKFLLQDRQLRPSSFTCRVYCEPHYFNFKISSAIRIFRKPSDEAMARQRPWLLLGMNLISSTALFYCMLCMETHSYFQASPLSIFLSSQMRI